MKVVFICSGNICRSPMAEGYFLHRAHGEGWTDVEVDSAGTLGIRNSRASHEAIEAMAARYGAAGVLVVVAETAPKRWMAELLADPERNLPSSV